MPDEPLKRPGLHEALGALVQARELFVEAAYDPHHSNDRAPPLVPTQLDLTRRSSSLNAVPKFRPRKVAPV